MSAEITPQESFAYRVSELAQYAELRAQRSLGADWYTAYTASWLIMDEVYALVLAADRPSVLTRFRPIRQQP